MAAVESIFKNGLVWLAEGSEADVATLPPLSTSVKNTAQFGLDAIDAQFPLGGLPTGAVHEWVSSRDIFPCSILALLAGNVLRKSLSLVPRGMSAAWSGTSAAGEAKKFVVWIGRDIWPTPYLLEQTMYITMQEGARSVSKSLLPHCLFIDPPHDKLKLWAIELALRSPAVAAVIADCKKLSFPISRKFSLAARAGNALGLLIRDQKAFNAPSAAASRWLIEPHVSASPSPCMQLKLIKCKGAQPKITSWVVELREGICAYEPEQQTLSLHVSSAVGGGNGAVSVEKEARLHSSAAAADREKRQSIAG